MESDEDRHASLGAFGGVGARDVLHDCGALLRGGAAAAEGRYQVQYLAAWRSGCRLLPRSPLARTKPSPTPRPGPTPG